MINTPSGYRPRIVIAGRRNAGKSSFINAITSQDLAIVSDMPGTTTDPVKKAMEILPIGPVMLIDTAGLDDVGEVGQMRIKRTMDEVRISDLVLLVVAMDMGFSDFERNFINRLNELKVSYAIVVNKIDIGREIDIPDYIDKNRVFFVSSRTGEGIKELKDSIKEVLPRQRERYILGDIISGGDIVVLVVPIDLAAPKGRLILPQVQTIREVLDFDAVAIITKERELRYTLDNLKHSPKIVVCDSQVIMHVMGDVPQDILLTTFSVLFARFKGNIDELIRGIKVLDSLGDGDRIAILEACTHHPMPDDIGRVKIPRWLVNYTGRRLLFNTFAGSIFPNDLLSYKLAIHCGGCMLTQRGRYSSYKLWDNYILYAWCIPAGT